MFGTKDAWLTVIGHNFANAREWVREIPMILKFSTWFESMDWVTNQTVPVSIGSG